MHNQPDTLSSSRPVRITERTLWWALFIALILAAVVMAAAWN